MRVATQWWDVECVVYGRVECYVKHGSGMWSWVWSRSDVVEWRNYARHVERPVKCGDSDVAGGVHNVATYGVIWNVAWSAWNAARNVKWGAVRDVAVSEIHNVTDMVRFEMWYRTEE